MNFDGTAIALVVAITAMVTVATRFHLSKDRPDFDATDLFMESGKLSAPKCVLVGSFLVTSWVLIRMAFGGNLPFEHFAAYLAAWVSPVLAALIRGKTAEPPK